MKKPSRSFEPSRSFATTLLALGAFILPAQSDVTLVGLNGSTSSTTWITDGLVSEGGINYQISIIGNFAYGGAGAQSQSGTIALEWPTAGTIDPTMGQALGGGLNWTGTPSAGDTLVFQGIAAEDGVYAIVNAADKTTPSVIAANKIALTAGQVATWVDSDPTNGEAYWFLQVDDSTNTDNGGLVGSWGAAIVNSTTLPSIVPPTNPADEASGVAISSDLVATFNKPIALTGAGTVTIRDLGAGPDVVIDLSGSDPDGSVTVSGATLTINPASDLVGTNDYAVQISADAIVDQETSPNAFAGILDDTTWNFETAAAPVPIADGTVIGIDFGPTAPAPSTNFNQVDTTLATTLSTVNDTNGIEVLGVSLAVTPPPASVFSNNDAADSTDLPGQPGVFDDTHLTDWLGENNAANDITLTFSGLDDALNYDLVIGSGFIATATNVDTTWSADGQSDTTDHGVGADAYVTLSNLETDGSGNLVITSAPAGNPNFTLISALTLTAVTPVAAPEIAVEQPASTDIPNNGSVDFGAVLLGSTADLTFTIRNTGDADLNLTSSPEVIVGGTDPGDFTVTSAPSTPVASGGGTTTFTVEFDPQAAGPRNATLTIANNDTNENPFVINVSGAGSVPLAPIAPGTEIGIDFGPTAPTNNFNQADGPSGSIAAGSVVDTSFVGVNGVGFSWADASGTSDESKVESEISGQPTVFDDSNTTDWLIAVNDPTNGLITLTFTGLDDSLTYDLLIGSAFSDTNPDTTWTADGQSDTTVSTSGTTAYVTLTGLSTDGSGNLVITSAGAGTRTDISVVSALTLTAAAGAGGDPFDDWATSGETFDSDANGDGVPDGIAFLLGAATPATDATSLLPAVSQSGSDLVMEFDCLAAADRGPAVLNLQYDGDLDAPWLTVPVPGAVGDPNPIVETTATGSVSFVATANGDLIHIVATITDATESAGGKLFGRLEGIE